MKLALPVVVENAETATFDCVYGRGCEGACCRNGRPSVGPDEEAAIRSVLPRVLPLLRPEARAALGPDGRFLSRRLKLRLPMVRVAGGWCVFFNAGCVLHKVGVEDGDAYQYKPTQCALFPLEKEKGAWFVRQWGHRGDTWDLFCLNPKASDRAAVEGLAGELALAAKLDAAGCGERIAGPGE